MKIVYFIEAVSSIEHVGRYLEHLWQYVNVSLNVFAANLRSNKTN